MCCNHFVAAATRTDEQSEHMLSGQTGSAWTAVYRRLHQETLISLIITASQIKGKDCKWSSEKFKGEKKNRRRRLLCQTKDMAVESGALGVAAGEV